MAIVWLLSLRVAARQGCAAGILVAYCFVPGFEAQALNALVAEHQILVWDGAAIAATAAEQSSADGLTPNTGKCPVP